VRVLLSDADGLAGRRGRGGGGCGRGRGCGLGPGRAPGRRGGGQRHLGDCMAGSAGAAGGL